LIDLCLELLDHTDTAGGNSHAVRADASLRAIGICSAEGWARSLSIPPIPGVLSCSVEVPVKASRRMTADGVRSRHTGGVVDGFEQRVGLLCGTFDADLGQAKASPSFSDG